MKSTSSMLTASLRGWLIFLFVFTLAGQVAAQSWTKLAPTGDLPPFRVLHSAVYNPMSNRMTVFAGLKGAGFVGVEPKLNDVWVLEYADGQGGTPNWIQLSPTGGSPIPRV